MNDRGRSRRDSQDSQMTVGMRSVSRTGDSASIISRASRTDSHASFASMAPVVPEKKKGLSALSGLLRRKQHSIPAHSVPAVEVSGRLSSGICALSDTHNLPVHNKPRAADPAQNRNSRSSGGLSGASSGVGSSTSAFASRTSLTRASVGGSEEKSHAYGGRVLGRFTGKGHKGRPSTAPGDVSVAPQPSHPASTAPSPPIFGLPKPPMALESPKSPLEPTGKRFELDTDLNDMEGIVDMSHLQAFSGPYSPGGPPVVAINPDQSSGRPITPNANTSSSASASHPGRLSTTSSGISEGSVGTTVTPVEQTDSPFQRQNPFFPIMDNASGVPVQLLPSSPQITLQKQSIASTQSYSRRPSQLRQVESLVSNASPNDSDFPPTPRRSESGFGDPFNDNTDGSKASEPSGRKRPNMRLDLQPNTFSMDAAGFKALSALTPDMMSPGTQMQAFRLTPLSEKGSAAAQAAWQAPESWGVEGDEEPEDAGSSDEADDLPDTSHDLIIDEGPTEQPIVQKVVPPFGYNSGMKRQRPHTGNTSRSRPTTEGAKLSIGTRPGTSGSNHANVTVSSSTRVVGDEADLVFPISSIS